MIRIAFAFIATLFFSTARGQGYGLIDDRDGYVNIRQRPDKNSKIVGRIYDQDIFFFNVIEGNNDWYVVQYGGQVSKRLDEMESYKRDFYTNELHYKSNLVDIEGYVHKSRIIDLSSLKKLNERIKPKDGELTVTNDTLVFQLKIGSFDQAKHKIEKSKNGSVQKIDGFIPLGIIDSPQLEAKNIKLTIRSKDIIIPKNDFNDLYELDLNRLSLLVDKKGTIYIWVGGSDGYAGYSVIWIIKNGKYLKREIGTS